MQTAITFALPAQKAFIGTRVAPQKPAAARVARFAARAEGAEAPAEAPKAWTAPTLDPNTPSPIFGGSTGA